MTLIRWFAVTIALLCAVAAVPVWRGYVDAMARAEQRVSMGSQLALTPCGPIEYAVVGKGNPILFVHGAGGGYDQGSGIARELAQQGLQVITVSRFGYLRTPLPADASAAAQADAHACLLDALGVERAVVIGVSAGAPSTMQLALRHPQRMVGMVLLVPAYVSPARKASPPPPATEFLFDTALRSDFAYWATMRVARDTLIESLLATPPAVVHRADADERWRVASMVEHILPVSERRLGLVNDARMLSTPSSGALERIEAPALIVSARDDGFGTWDNAREIAARLPHARFVGYESGGHVWVGHHQEVLAEVVAFARAAPPPVARP